MYNNQTTLSTVRAAAYDITSLLIKETGTTVLEPIMNLKIIVPSNYSAVVIRDFNGKRRGNILNVESVGDSTSIEGRAALETLVGYSSEIRGICRGSGEWSMELCDYEEVTSNQRAQNL